MARSPHTAAQLQSFVDTFEAMVATLDRCIADIKSAEPEGFPGVWIHADTIQNTRLPEVMDWVDAVEKEVKTQLRAFRTGQTNRAKQNVERAARNAPKPPAKARGSAEPVVKKSRRKGA